MNTTRRDFIKVGAGAVAATSSVSTNSREVASPTASGVRTEAPTGEAEGMIYRKFGSTDAHISAIGVGGHHLGDVPTLDEAVQLVHEAIDAGVTFFDNAWEYYNGKTETILGRALRDGRRDKVFLMTKVCTHGLEETYLRLGRELAKRTEASQDSDVGSILDCIADRWLSARSACVTESIRKRHNIGDSTNSY
jgi:predicted aldo/keto reductase-like oxidoreductase